MLSCLFLVLALVVLYIFVVYELFGKLPTSLSQTAYMFGGYKKYIFTAVCYSIGFGILPALFELTPDNLTFLPFIFGVGLFLAGLTPAFMDTKYENRIHTVSAIIAFVAYLVYLIICMDWYWLFIFVVGFLSLYSWKKKCYIFFAEILAILSVTLWCIIELWKR